MKNETTACVKHSLRQRVNSYMATLPSTTTLLEYSKVPNLLPFKM